MFTSPPPPPYTIVLLRHGESVGNAEGYHQGQADFPLSETGRLQAQALASRWHTEQVTFDRLISSPLLRARETAEIIASALNLPFEFNHDWMERDAGLLSGLHHDEASQRYPRPAFMHPYQPVGRTGESQWELFLRAGRAVQSLLNYPSGHFLVVAHSAILNMVLYAMLGIMPQANFTGPRFTFSNTGFASLSYTPDEHAWRVLGINDHAHWRDEE